ncbi:MULTISPECIES: deoxyribose-phosphate aldolase [unclassified Pseudactinotalea]|uniref:deoxyribose-phosphate aldolase n=1 Tax=unclassified Pseudactinotalea TaxID=2649176 RepID=UPI00128BEF45|nr:MULTISPECIES: deoxyribose-phosphate aldolase [unclassified Pseudactinotalea]MPV51108.1 deoxyribose-phosphate aldolase [Pseudactinotalea sp. HY160]QGH70302.1 deoxyribose-phosphate aldolase [Pseudactinotalea sp. HY158]
MTRTTAGAPPALRPWHRSAAEVAATAAGIVGTDSLTSANLGRYLHGLPGVDKVGADARAGMLSTRSIKTSAKAWALDAIISMIDLTTLEGADTPGKVRSLVAKARTPDPSDPGCPRPAAVCVYNDLVPVALEAVAGTGIHVAAVSTAFPSGRASRAVRLADTADAVSAGAHEIDMVIDRGAFLAGDYARVFEDIVAVREVCRSRPEPAHLKVILETGELVTYDNVRRASWLAMLAGADFIKTSTGKVNPAATLPVTVLMLEAVRDFAALTGVSVGVKPAGGIRGSKQAVHYLVAVNEVAGETWLDPELFRFGASSLLNDVLAQRRKLTTGAYTGPDYITID